MRALLAGWFSYEGYGATAGDLMSRDVVSGWLRQAGRAFDVVCAPPFEPTLTWEDLVPELYSDVVFVCGPFGNGPPITELLERFAHCRFYGVNLSMLQSVHEWNPFHLLLERDSDRHARPDLTFIAPQKRVPVVGVILVHPQSEYGDRGLHDQANAGLERLLAEREAVRVSIDTRLDDPCGPLRTPAEVLALIGRMDAVVTTRLHGTVLALKQGVPVLPVDPIRGGAKITKQVRALDWPILFAAEHMDEDDLRSALEYCLSPRARARAITCAAAAVGTLDEARTTFVRAIAWTGGP